jgi:hypothetical protein
LNCDRIANAATGELPPQSREAMICSFECTFCAACVERRLLGRCPNCGGELVRRPIRPADQTPAPSGLDTARVQAAWLCFVVKPKVLLQPARPRAGIFGGFGYATQAWPIAGGTRLLLLRAQRREESEAPLRIE